MLYEQKLDIYYKNDLFYSLKKHLTFLDMYLDSPRSCAEQHSDSLEEVAWV